MNYTAHDTQHTVRLMCWLFILVLILGACSQGNRKEADVSVGLEIFPDPPLVGPAQVVVTLEEADGGLITGAQVNLEGNMNHPGMVPVLAEAKETEPGRYEADLEFTMGGDWYILVQAELADGRTIEHQVDVAGVKRAP